MRSIKGCKVFVVMHDYYYQEGVLSGVFEKRLDAVNYILKEIGKEEYEFKPYMDEDTWDLRTHGYSLKEVVIG